MQNININFIEEPEDIVDIPEKATIELKVNELFSEADKVEFEDPRLQAKYQKHLKKQHRREVLGAIYENISSFVLLILKTILVSTFIMNTLIEITYVPSSSMVPTLEVGNFEIANKLHYFFKEPERGDIVIFYRDNDVEYEKLFTKRVIGLPGDKVKINNGILYINNIAYHEPYLQSDAGENFKEIVVPENSYLMLGDNRYNSADSRYWEETFVSKKNIVGKVMFIVDFGDLNK